jgi:hypothetical protein
LEVVYTIDIVAREDFNVHLLEEGRGPGFVGIHFADQGHYGLVCCRLVAVDGGLDVDSELGDVAICLRRRRQEQEWNLAAFFRQEIGCSVGQPAAAVCDGSVEVVWNALAEANELETNHTHLCERGRPIRAILPTRWSRFGSQESW